MSFLSLNFFYVIKVTTTLGNCCWIREGIRREWMQYAHGTHAIVYYPMWLWFQKVVWPRKQNFLSLFLVTVLPVAVQWGSLLSPWLTARIWGESLHISMLYEQTHFFVTITCIDKNVLPFFCFMLDWYILINKIWFSNCHNILHAFIGAVKKRNRIRWDAE